ncbi:testis development-related protein isoform X2 [Protopterus annectens]|uniref:testis development-related protein isoform X2 n=1 Tax=Protopterus annectens TaxID=7888 RepID=UPI001CFBC967|nr:testis development-related protein isoform X2 [Protopterus annectens]XP_043929493.1 testis development-related protein isoform X2 [Protopterus annectens]XP_043929500.1 testis development-related protein isoform X2 [Protopterus annectens]
MWKINRSKVLIDEPVEEHSVEKVCQNSVTQVHPLDEEAENSVSQPASKVQGAGFLAWKEVTSLFNKDDEKQLLTDGKTSKPRGPSVKLKDETKVDKKPGFWDSLIPKQNLMSRKPDEMEGWEPAQVAMEDTVTDASKDVSESTFWPAWEEEEDGTKASSKYTNLASSSNTGSKWSIKSAGKLVSIKKRSKGNLTESFEELE